MLRCLWLILFTWWVIACPAFAQVQALDAKQAQARREMVAGQLAGRGIIDARVLAAMGRVPRHLFVPPQWRERAYGDHPLPIGEEQTISQPLVVALMTQAARVKPGDKVLEIGTGSGYQAAVLAELAQGVFSMEIVPRLHRRAKKRLAELGYDRVRLRLGNGWAGWPEEAPFDVILVTAAPPEIPPALLRQLAPGGRMVLPLGPQGQAQELVVISKDARGRFWRQELGAVSFVPMIRPQKAED